MRFFSRLKRGGPSNNASLPKTSGEKDANLDTRDSSLSNFQLEKDPLEKDPNAMLHQHVVEYEREDVGYQTENDDSYNSEEDDDEFEEMPTANSSRVRQPRILDAMEMMADDLYRYGCDWRQWFSPPSVENHYGNVNTGVALRSKKGSHILYPHSCPGLEEFGWAVTELNPMVAMKLSSPIVRTILSDFVGPQTSEFVINADSRIQVLDDMTLLARARKHQYAAFIRDEGVLCVWSDNVKTILAEAEGLEDSLLEYIWNQGHKREKKVGASAFVEAAKAKELLELDEKIEKLETGVDAGDAEDLSKLKSKRQWKERPYVLFDAVTGGLTVGVMVILLSISWRKLIREYMLDGKAMRFLLILASPFLGAVGMFSFQFLIGSFWQIFGPVAQVTRNSVFYSGIAPRRITKELPHVTVWLPVYKEALEEVIMPTIQSLKVAQATYERQGGTVSILVCDDGLQVINEEEVEARKRFYHNNNMAYVSRPGHGVNGFERRGRFKKASNMNFAIQLSLRVEEILDEMRPLAQEASGVEHFWDDEDEQSLYEASLSQAVAESEGQALADGNIRIGAVVLIIDSDTRVPEDCFVDAVSELEASPEVAIIQHSSGVMQVANHFFENGIAHFIRSIQLSISFYCANGTSAPFVGHNAFLRWSALQDIMWEEDGVKKVWSETHVSEDFAMSMALQLKGYTVRWATYSDDKFEEGVSLTCGDEVNRWQKYAWGVSEIIFHPFRYWITRGPFTPLFRKFLWCDLPLPSKISTLAYMFSYYAIAAAWPIALLNFVILGFVLPVDDFYMSAWYYTFACILLFFGLGNLAAILLRYRLKVAHTGSFAMNQIKYIPFYAIFFAGLSLQVSAAICCHLIGYQMSWAATAKTVEASNFFKEVPSIMRKFKVTLPLNWLIVAFMVIASTPLMPHGWRVDSVEAIVPLALTVSSHLLYPVALNPWFMHFSF